MAIEPGADQIAVLRPGVERIGGGVDPAESFSIPDEGQKIGLLPIVQFQFAAGEEVQDVEIAQGFSGDQREIVGGDYFEFAGAGREVFHHSLRRGNAIVPESG